MNDSDHRSFWQAIEQSLGADAINRSDETILRYGEHHLAMNDVPPNGVVFPRSSAEVQTVVRVANAHEVALYPISTGQNQGLGLRSPMRPGQVVVDLGRHMNRILEIDEQLCYAVLEPGVTYQQLYDELGLRGHKLMLDTTSGPPAGGVLGNTLDGGAGYTPYFDHFYMSCGVEVVLGNGELLRTGDGSLPGSQAWHVSKYTVGPALDGLFRQSNYGIATRIGVWLMPKPPVIRTFFFSFPHDDDLETIIELCRPLKMSNVVPTLFKVTNDLYALATECTHPEYDHSGGREALSDTTRRALQQTHGTGAWLVSGAFYGASDKALAPFLDRIQAHFGQSGKARYITHEEAESNDMLRIHVDSFRGVPTLDELKMLRWRPGGGLIWFLPGTPMLGATANAHQRLAREIYTDHGFEYIVQYVCGARFARGLHVLLFNRENDEERARADACYRALAQAFADRGYSVGRAATGYQALHMQSLDPQFRSICQAIKGVLDPNGVIAPGRYGIG